MLYGASGPRWYIVRRGRRWLRSGFCPMCYSSPPRADCPVCRGSQHYGNNGFQPINEPLRRLWAKRWALIIRPE